MFSAPDAVALHRVLFLLLDEPGEIAKPGIDGAVARGIGRFAQRTRDSAGSNDGLASIGWGVRMPAEMSARGVVPRWEHWLGLQQ